MLPDAHTSGTYSVALVCLGNICRSPIAHVVLASRLEQAGLGGHVSVESSGTGDWHIGKPMDRRAAATLTGSGYDATAHLAQQFAAPRAAAYDLVLAMDRSNLDDLRRLGVPQERLMLFRDFDPMPGDGEVPDPYYGGEDGFVEVLAIVERTAGGLVRALQEHVQDASGRR